MSKQITVEPSRHRTSRGVTTTIAALTLTATTLIASGLTAGAHQQPPPQPAPPEAVAVASQWAQDDPALAPRAATPTVTGPATTPAKAPAKPSMKPAAKANLKAALAAARAALTSFAPIGPEHLTDPLPGGLTVMSPFGPRFHPLLHAMMQHTGIDLSASCGTPIYAAASGTVIYAGISDSWGGRVIIEHPNLDPTPLRTAYGHMSVMYARQGDHVTQGQQIGLVGTTGWSTGCHLHFDVVKGGGYINPAPYLSGMGAAATHAGPAHSGVAVPNVKHLPTVLPSSEDNGSTAATSTSTPTSTSTSAPRGTGTATATSTKATTTTPTKTGTSTSTPTATSTSTPKATTTATPKPTTTSTSTPTATSTSTPTSTSTTAPAPTGTGTAAQTAPSTP